MTHVFHRDPRLKYPVAVRGEGAYLYDRDGKRYLDASGGAAVSCLGHSDPAVIGAIQRQLEKLPFAHTSFFSNEPMEALADALIARAPKSFDKVYFVSGGSEAIEAALKLARQYFVEKGEPQRAHIIGRRQSYHGNTLGALRRRQRGGASSSSRSWIKTTHVSPLLRVSRQDRLETDAAYGERLAGELESEIQRLGEKSVIAFVAETVAGATIGAVPPVPGYFKRVREICDRYGVLLILDEVMCGMGRCGTLWTFEQEGIVPDMVAVAKGLGPATSRSAPWSCRKRSATRSRRAAVFPARTHLHRTCGGLRRRARGPASLARGRRPRTRQAARPGAGEAPPLSL